MKNKIIEKGFKIEVIASLLENKFLKTKENNLNEQDIYELCSHVTGLKIDKSNFYYIGEKIKNLVVELQPELNIRINKTDDTLSEKEIKAIINYYKNTFGDTYNIKTACLCTAKTLKRRDK